jgi:hypothetical protein
MVVLVRLLITVLRNTSFGKASNSPSHLASVFNLPFNHLLEVGLHLDFREKVVFLAWQVSLQQGLVQLSVFTLVRHW